MKNNDLLNLKKTIFLIALGIFEKEHSNEKGYINNYRLRHGINIFWGLALKYKSKNLDFNDMNETYFMKNYACKPLQEWFADWQDVDKLGVKTETFYNYDAFIICYDNNTYYVTEACESCILSSLKIDAIKNICPNALEEIEEHKFYDAIRLLSQDNYVTVRRFIIQNKIISEEKLQEFRIENALNKDIVDCINMAYETVNGKCCVCPRCGWTMYKYKNEYICQSRECSNKIYLEPELMPVPIGSMRLKRSIMRYVAAPGMLELEIKEYCEKHKLKSSLWPQNDKYDVEIIFNSGKVWEIDAKAIKNPYYLKESVETDSAFSKENIFDEGYYVVPDELAKLRPDYLRIVNEAIDKKIKSGELKNVRCVTLRQLKRIIKKECELNE